MAAEKKTELKRVLYPFFVKLILLTSKEYVYTYLQIKYVLNLGGRHGIPNTSHLVRKSWSHRAVSTMSRSKTR